MSGPAHDARFDRTRALVGGEGMARLQRACVAIFGLGGVGGYALEAVARAGVGRLVVVDADLVEPTNINRQLLATEQTLGMAKVDAAKERVRAINPAARIDAFHDFVDGGNTERFLEQVTHAIDAIDSLNPKVRLLETLHRNEVPTVSCMGAACRRDPSRVHIADIRDTQGCPLARRVRQRLRRAGVESGILCVYSDEPVPPMEPLEASVSDQGRPRASLGSTPHLPGIIGLTAAGLVINAILDGVPPIPCA